jgi:hypothetical protein
MYRFVQYCFSACVYKFITPEFPEVSVEAAPCRWLVWGVCKSPTTLVFMLCRNNLYFVATILSAAFASKDRWVEHLRALGLRVIVAPENTKNEIADLSRVEFAICWQPPEGLLRRCPNLKAIQSMGAGVDSLLSDQSLPRHVPLLRVRFAALFCQTHVPGFYTSRAEMPAIGSVSATIKTPSNTDFCISPRKAGHRSIDVGTHGDVGVVGSHQCATKMRRLLGRPEGAKVGQRHRGLSKHRQC